MRYLLSIICTLFISVQAYCFPVLTGAVVDEANVLSSETETTISQMLEHENVYNVVVASVASLGGIPVEQYARDLGNYWGVGDSKKDDGVILLFAPVERVVRIATGMGMEKILTDERADKIIAQILPYLKKGDYDTAAIIGTQSIMLAFDNLSALQGNNTDIYLVYGIVVLIVLCCVYYVMSAPDGEKGKRFKHLFIGAISLIGVFLLMVLTLGRGGKGGNKFSGGGHFGSGGSTGHF